MKQNHTHSIRTLTLTGALAVALWGCQKDDFTPQNNHQPDGLNLTVIDGGYTGSAANDDNGKGNDMPPTRAIENGYKTTFTAGDQIGIYAVKNDALTTANTNIRLTLTDIGDGVLQWQPPTGIQLPVDADRYFIYYPYKASPGTGIPSATDADAFFANIIKAWSPSFEQSDVTKYTSKDLMVGSGTPGASTAGGIPLAITLEHKMGLAIVKLPEGVTDITFYNFNPYQGVSGEYRYLVKPSTPTPLSGSFTDGGEARGYTINATVTAGNYKTYNVQGKP